MTVVNLCILTKRGNIHSDILHINNESIGVFKSVYDTMVVIFKVVQPIQC